MKAKDYNFDSLIPMTISTSIIDHHTILLQLVIPGIKSEKHISPRFHTIIDQKTSRTNQKY